MIKCEKLNHQGLGLARIDGKITFIFGALPGEDCDIVYKKRLAKFDEAQATAIASPAKDRVQPRCQYFGTCGGCSLQHLKSSEQIKHKEQVLIEQLAKIGKISPQKILPPLSGKSYGYRSKARYSLFYDDDKQMVHLGFRALFDPNTVPAIDSCSILDERLNAHIPLLNDLLNSFSDKKNVYQIDAAAGDDAVAFSFSVFKKLSAQDQEKIDRYQEENGVKIFCGEPGHGDASQWLTRTIIDGIKIRFHPSDFMQVNAQVNNMLISQAMELLDLKKNDRVLDLFSGLGNFSLPAARLCGEVLSIEGDKNMVDRAQENAALNNISNIKVAAADLKNPTQVAGIKGLAGCNKIIIDPPRTGAKALVESLDLTSVEKILYVSCNPSTLARDAGILKDRGFKLETVGVMDMFSHTEHVEAMALFSRAK